MYSPPLVVAIPMLVACLLSAGREWLPGPLRHAAALAASTAVLCLDVHLLERAWSAPFVYWFGDWFPRGRVVVGVGFAIEPLGCVLALLAAVLMVLALVYSLHIEESGRGFYLPLMLIFLAAMSGFCLTGDLFNLFVFFELMSIAAFALCGLNSGEPAPLQGAFNFAITNSVGAFLMLTGIGMIYAVTGALNLAQIQLALQGRHDPLVVMAFLLIAAGFLIKAAMVPFHFWLADAHAVAPTSVCVLFSGIMVPLGLFAVARLGATAFSGSFAAAISGYRLVFVLLGAITACLGAIMCFAEHHIKRLLAFSTISHTGLMLIGFGLATPAAVAGALVYLGAHALIKSGLFMVAGIYLVRLGSLSEHKLFGRVGALRLASALWLLGGLGLTGLPPFATAAGADWIHAAAAEVGLAQVRWVFWLAGALTGAAVLRCGLRMVFGWGDAGPSDRSAEIREKSEIKPSGFFARIFMITPPLLCMAGGIGVSFIGRLHLAALRAATEFLSTSTFTGVIYASQAALPPVAHPELAAVRFGSPTPGVITALVALLVAAVAVWHRLLPRRMRVASHLEGSMAPLRAAHSGHAGDYVAWITCGAAALGAALLYAVR